MAVNMGDRASRRSVWRKGINAVRKFQPRKIDTQRQGEKLANSATGSILANMKTQYTGIL
jgi:hypothetical protein